MGVAHVETRVVRYMFRFHTVFEPGSAMHRAVCNVMVTALLAHVVFGCCLHHAHACAALPGAATDCKAACPCDHGEDQGDHGSRHQRCHVDRCVFRAAESRHAPHVSVGEACLAPACVVADLPGQDGIEIADPAPHVCGLPIGLYLLNQALLL